MLVVSAQLFFSVRFVWRLTLLSLFLRPQILEEICQQLKVFLQRHRNLQTSFCASLVGDKTNTTFLFLRKPPELTFSIPWPLSRGLLVRLFEGSYSMLTCNNPNIAMHVNMLEATTISPKPNIRHPMRLATIGLLVNAEKNNAPATKSRPIVNLLFRRLRIRP